ncbi:MAG: hypothetical protein AVDCRST_MAG39-244 [uncultured Sphingomonadaceae bacterium]|uniref:Lipoprotein n=1 Tax=uncultured Sphingomonadaceae bacterium TaxID=169976 RepID=A0A6J4S231_9SPHN|nr:MAG: hypothetical protein AVDCRST_MAG39-244 [uncultured Sphingomonadaceae bacterium]
MKRLRPATACLLLQSCGEPDGVAAAPERAVAAADRACRLPCGAATECGAKRRARCGATAS